MLENNLMLTESEDEELDEAIDDSLASFPLVLNDEEKQIIQEIMNAEDQKSLEEQFSLFNMNQSKKNAIRIIKLNDLLGKIEDQAIKRFTKTPENISNKELLEYMQVVANQIDRSQKVIDTISSKPMIKLNAPKTEVNINIGTELNRDSKEKVVDAIQSLLKQLNQQQSDSEENIIEAEEIKDQNCIDIEEPDDLLNSEISSEDEGDND